MLRREFLGGCATLLIPTGARAWTRGTVNISLAQLKLNYIAMQWGVMLTMGMCTFLDAESNNPVAVNTWAPTAFNMDQWISACVAAKAKYAVLVAKHHDGFCLWPSATTTYDIAATSWYTNNGNPDIVSQFCTKARAAGISPILYFSIRDANSDGGNPPANPATFKTFLQAQLTELAAYGPAAIWLDGAEWWYGSATPWSSSTQRNDYIRGLRTNMLAIDNSHTGADSDIIVFESSGFPIVGNTVPSEAVTTIKSDGNYFWKSTGNSLITSSTILTDISTANGRACNFLLSVSPDNTGVIPTAMVSLLTTVGASL
jgi:alpha-L-fucosidase